MPRPTFDGPVAESARAIDGPGKHGGAGSLVHRHALAGQQRFVDCGLALHHLSIHRNALARTRHHQLVHAHVFHRDLHFDAIPQHARHRRLQIHQLADGRTGLTASPRFQRPAKQDQRDDHGRGLVIHFVTSPHRLHQRIEECSARAQRNQRVHVGGAVTQGAPRGHIKRRAGVHDHRQSESQLNPRRIGYMQNTVRHAENEHGRREDRRHQQAPAVSMFRCVGRRFLLRYTEAQLLNRANEIAHLRDARVELDGRRVGGQIDAGPIHARSVGQIPFDAACAGGTRHPRDRQVHALRSGSLHAGTSKPS